MIGDRCATIDPCTDCPTFCADYADSCADKLGNCFLAAMEGGLRDDHPCMNPDLCPRVKGDDERNGKCETLVREYCSAENSDCTPVGCSAAMEIPMI